MASQAKKQSFHNMEQANEEQLEEQQQQEAQQEEQRGENLIIVTGFGPFVGHETVNASWEAVRLLPDKVSFQGTDYVLEKQMVDVEYAAVDKAVQAIWAREPKLVIHCGVHGSASCVHIEKLAYNHRFKRPDYAGKRLKRGSACLINCRDGIENDVIRCRLNVEKIVKAIAESCKCTPETTAAPQDQNEAEQKETEATTNIVDTDPVLAKASLDVGNYLCGYIYLKSLDMNKNRSLFVHVPPIDKPLSSPQTSEVILKVVEECVRQVEEDLKGVC